MTRRAAARPAAAPIGVAIFLATWSMLVLALCYASVSLRQTPEWAALTPRLGAGAPLALCGLIVASSIALELRRRGVALVCAVVFIAGQSALLARGAALADGHASSVLVLLTSFHGLHAILGIAAIGRRALLGRPTGYWSVFWHALGVSWLVIVGVLFL